jgi:hypothetical protein
MHAILGFLLSVSLSGGLVWADTPQEWLERSHEFLRALRWAGAGPRHSYAFESWEESEKQELYDAIAQAERALQNREDPAWTSERPELPENLRASGLGPRSTPITTLEEGLAWRIYLDTLGLIFAADRLRLYPWSLKELSSTDLSLLLNGTLLWVGDGVGRVRLNSVDTGVTQLTHPYRLYQFMRDEVGIGNTRRKTIENLLRWIHPRFRHFSGEFSLESVVKQWGYPGTPPAIVMIRQAQPITAGCHGTTGFLQVMLKLVGIPVRYAMACRHAQPEFPTEGLYLSHGDDLYGGMSHYSRGVYPVERLLIDQTQYDEWFVHGDACKNVARTPIEIGLDILPDYLLGAHCKDLETRTPAYESRVAMILSKARTPEELQELQVWRRIESELATHGGCDRYRKEYWGR